jgi:hypothetical protein
VVELQSEELVHRGVRYRVQAMQAHRWRWQVEPPMSVLGLHSEDGELAGTRQDAIKAARHAIDAQTRHFDS